MKVLIVTDSWHPLINGVVRTLEHTGKELEKKGHEVIFLSPQWPGLKTFPLITYSEIRLPWNNWEVGRIIKKLKPDAIHVATEGTLGVATKIFCHFNKMHYSSSYHTKTPEYIKSRYPWFNVAWGYWYMKWLHKTSKAVLVTTPSMKEELFKRIRHKNLVVWGRGVDLELFHPSKRTIDYHSQSLPLLLYVGRISIEKNLEAFLSLPNTLYRKIVVGDGPARLHLEKKYNHPNTLFLGYKTGEELARVYANSDVFVFPSMTDTFGIVMIEANASGIPVAAFPVTGPKDFVKDGVNGYLDDKLYIAVEKAIQLNRKSVRDFVEKNYSWEKAATIFESIL
ncbi:MAG: glycosyltransferase family 1 protein [Candidatus Marinimicrobia bacterium]|nr:glycosyltransferase family 1 protein [Candidatus Neomarinimicrobiota bacterium]